MITLRRILVLLILPVFMVLAAGCKQVQSSSTATASLSGAIEVVATKSPVVEALPQDSQTATQPPPPSSTSTSAPTSTKTLIPTQQPPQTPTNTPTITPTLVIAALSPGVYSSGGCLDYTYSKPNTYGWPWASFTWCVEYIEIHKDGSMIFVMSWKLVDFSEGLTSVTKRSDVNNSNMYLTDNLDNRYDAIIVSGDAAGDIVMEKDVTYYGTFTFRPPKPGAFRFTFHDDDTGKEISNIILEKPAVYIYDIQLTWSPLDVTYYSDKWTVGQTEQGGIKLTHQKYANCEVMEWQSGEAQGKYRGSIDIGDITYDMYSTSESNWTVREYAYLNGLGNTELASLPIFSVTIPYDNQIPCIDDASSVLASLKLASP